MRASVSPVGAQPAISIVIPSLNQGAFIEQAVRSVIDQRYPHVELIVMDGGSRDRTRDVLERYQSGLTRWISDADDGPAAALRAGFADATGTIFGVLNADDFLLPGSLDAIAMAFDERPQVDVISGHGYYSSPDGTLTLPAYSDPWEPTRFRYGACVLLQPATFFRSRAYVRAGGFRHTGRVCWDMELWADMAATGSTFAVIDRPLAAFRLHDASITGRRDQRVRRRRDARAVAAETSDGDSALDCARHYWHRALKFARHPLRALRQRWFFFVTLRRWSL